MNKTLLILILLFVNTFLVIGQDWNTVKQFVPTQTLNDVYTIDEMTVYTVSALYNGTDLNIKKTTDGGVTWTEQNSGHLSNNFRRIGSPNNGTDLFIIGNSGIVIHSGDGETWTTLDIGTTEHLRDIFFLNESIGYISADNSKIFKTTDGGTTWIDINASIVGVNSIGRIYFLTEMRGFVAGFNFFQETFDGGLTWGYVPGHEPQPGGAFQIQGIHFVDENVGYIHGDVGLLYKTIDAGDTWEDIKVTIPGFTVESLFSLDFIDNDPNIGFACGYHGLLIRTFDAGDTWELMTSDVAGTNTPEGAIFPSLEFNKNMGYMTGHSGQVLTYEYEDASSVIEYEENENVVIFPNPTSDVFSIENIIGSIDKIVIYDILGRVHKVIENPMSNQINCEALIQGKYIIQITSGDKIYNKLLIKE